MATTNAPHRPEPFGRYLHAAETAEVTHTVRHCEAPRCREPVTVYLLYYPRRSRRDGTPIGQERFLCGPHGIEFAVRHGLLLDAAPAQPTLHEPRPDPAIAAPARLERLDADAAADFAAHGWHCARRRCDQLCAYASMYTSRGARPRRVLRFLCDGHAASFAARHHIDLVTVPVAHGAFR
jgi:hypothetical protein